jgi:hypothetical protein
LPSDKNLSRGKLDKLFVVQQGVRGLTVLYREDRIYIERTPDHQLAVVTPRVTGA